MPDVEVYQGRTIDSPLSAVMNAAFVLQGLLYLAAAVLAARAVRAAPRSSVRRSPSPWAAL